MISCKTLKNPRYDYLRTVVGDVNALQISEMYDEAIPHEGFNGNGEYDEKFSVFMSKFNGNKAARMWWDLHLVIGKDFENYTADVDGNGSVFIEKDGVRTYVTPMSIANGQIDTNYDKLPGIRAHTDRMLDFFRKQQVVNLVDKMAANLGFGVIKETMETARKKDHFKDKGWVDGQGVHINMDAVTIDTFVHELTHVWMYWLKQSDVNAYNRIMSLAAENAAMNPLVADLVREKYGDANRERFFEEYFATVSGFHSINEIMRYLNNNELLQEDQRLSANIRDNTVKFVQDNYREFHPMFDGVSPGIKDIDLSVADFSQILSAITSDFVSGRSMYSQEEIVAINASLRYDMAISANPYLSQTLNTPKINTTKDFVSFLSGKSMDGDNVGIGTMSDERKAMLMATSLKEDEYGTYIKFKGTKYYIANSLTIEQKVDKIVKEVIPEMKKYDNKVKEAMGRFLSNYNPYSTTDNAIEQFCKEYKLNPYSFKHMIKQSGLANGFKKIVRYSELATDTDSRLRALYHKDFVGVNPYVIVHSMGKDEAIHVSMLDFTTEKLNTIQEDGSPRNLLGRGYMNDVPFYKKGGTLKNSNGGLHMFLNGLTALYMANHGVAFNVISTFTTPDTAMQELIVPSISELFENIKIVKEQTEISQNIDSPAIKALFDDEASFDIPVESSYVTVLRNYVLSSPYGRSSELNKLFVGGVVSRQALTYGIFKRMRVVQNKYRTLDELKNDKEYQLLSLAYNELKGMPKGFMKNLQDITPTQRNFAITHFAPSFLQQFIKEQYDNTIFTIIDEVRNFQRSTAKLRKKVYRQLKSGMVGTDTADFFFSNITDASSSIFSKMFMEQDVAIYKDGKKVGTKRVVLPWLIHSDINDVRTAQALREGKITKDMIEYGKTLLLEIEDRIVRNIIHEAYMKGTILSHKDAWDIYTSRKESVNYMNDMRGAFFPVIEKSSTEMFNSIIKKADFKETVKSYKDKVAGELENDFNIFADAYAGNSELDNLSTSFSGQQDDFNKVLQACGMFIDNDGNIAIENMSKYNTVSLNIEAASSFFMINSSRKENIEKNFMPSYNATIAAATYYSRIKGNDNELKNTLSWIEEYKTIVIDKKSATSAGKSLSDKRLAIIEGAMLKAYSSAVLGFYFPVTMKSLAFNTIQSHFNTIARDLGKRKDDENASTLFGEKDLVWASAAIFNNMDKAFSIARDLQLIDSTERDMLQNPVNMITQRYALQSQTMHLGNWMTDNFARVVSMMAQMHYDGTWDAVNMNAKTGKYEYDPKKDRRFYTEDGKLKTENGEQAIRRKIYEDNVALGLEAPTEDLDKMTRPYNVSEAKKMKHYADIWVVGAMSDDVRALISSHLFMRSISQFRLFSYARLNRFGIGAWQHETILGTGIKAKKIDGEWVAEREIREFEAQLASLYEGVKAIANIRKQGLGKWWKESSEERRSNIARAGLQMAAVLIVFGLMAALKPEDDEYSKYMAKKRQQYKWIWWDLIDCVTLIDVYKSPIPSLTLISDLWEIVFGDSEWERLFRYIPAVNTVYKYDKDFFAGITGDEENEETE